MIQLKKSIYAKYVLALFVLSSFLWKSAISNFPYLDQGLTTLRFIAMVFLFLQTSIIFYRIRNNIGFRQSDNIIAAISNAFKIIVYFSIFFLLLRYNGVSPIQFFTSISIVAAAIAIVSKDYLTSIISGFFISFTKIINIGDYISINEIRGKVKDIKLTKLFLENDQGELIILGNEKVFLSDIINHSKSNKRRISLEFELAPSGLNDIEEIEKSLIETLEEFDQQIVENSFSLRVDNIFIDKICFTFFYTLEKLEADTEKEIRKKTIRNLIKLIQIKNTPM